MNGRLFYLIVDEFVTCWSLRCELCLRLTFISKPYNAENIVYEQFFIDYNFFNRISVMLRT